MEYGYELREDGCFHTTLNSYSPLYNDLGNFFSNCDKEIGDTYDEVYRWIDSHTINNSDNTGGFSSEEDIRVAINWYNNLYDENAGFEPGLELNSITINNKTFNWDEIGFTGVGRYIDWVNFNPNDVSLTLDITTEVDITDSAKYLNIAWIARGTIGKDEGPEFVIGEDVSINLDDFALPLYEYRVQGQFCMIETEDYGPCTNVDKYFITFDNYCIIQTATFC